MKIISITIFVLFSVQVYGQELSKTEKRYIAPNSIFVELGSGLFYGRSFSQTEGFSNRGARASWMPFVKLELGLKKNFFAELELTTQRYYPNIRYGNFGSAGGQPYRAAKFSFGVGYRLIKSATNYNFGSLSFGASISYQNEIGITGSGGGSQGYGEGYFEESGYSAGVNKIFPTFYIGFDKDVQLTKNLYLSIGYRYDHGYITVHEMIGTYRTEPVGNFLPYYGKTNGSAHSYTAGIKYKFER